MTTSSFGRSQCFNEVRDDAKVGNTAKCDYVKKNSKAEFESRSQKQHLSETHKQDVSPNVCKNVAVKRFRC